ncbi:MAG: Cof-type HAD-IIB family hydrolase [Acutalibacteraceae bacterium]|nr:Cof-type HAD-IIB family hydrolase [Acutalibacteraceae bacterium]
MGKFDGILICSDLDGTLLNSNSEVSGENLEAIEYFKSEGGYFTFITGRMPSYVKKLYDCVKPNAPIGCVNGGGVYDYKTGKYLWTHGLQNEVIELVEYIDKNVDGIGIQVNTFDNVYFCTENEAQEEFRRVTGLPKLYKHYKDIDEPIAKISFDDLKISNIEKVAELLNNHERAKEYYLIRSDSWLYEILPKGINKGVVLPKIAEFLNIPREKCIAVGDYNNDIQMIDYAGVGIAVENAVDEVKAVADYITVKNDEHAIAQIVKDIEKGNIKI